MPQERSIMAMIVATPFLTPLIVRALAMAMLEPDIHAQHGVFNDGY